jgi:hypothetical protein
MMVFSTSITAILYLATSQLDAECIQKEHVYLLSSVIRNLCLAEGTTNFLQQRPSFCCLMEMSVMPSPYLSQRTDFLPDPTTTADFNI